MRINLISIILIFLVNNNNMKKSISVICASLMILTGLYYLIAEFICIHNCGAQFPAYYKHTISELCVPFSLTGFSSYYKLMVSAFLVVAPTFFICYNILFLKHLKKCKVLCFIFSLFLLIGLLMVGIFNCKSKETLHFIGAFLTFSCCNILVLLTILFSNIFTKPLKILAISISIFGIISSFLTISLKSTAVFPIFERLTVYPVIIFCFITGFLFLKRNLINKPNNSEIQKAMI